MYFYSRQLIMHGRVGRTYLTKTFSNLVFQDKTKLVFKLTNQYCILAFLIISLINLSLSQYRFLHLSINMTLHIYEESYPWNEIEIFQLQLYHLITEQIGTII